MEEKTAQPKAEKVISTVFLIIFLLVVCFLCWLMADLLVVVKNYSPEPPPEFEEMSGEDILFVAILAGAALAAPFLLIEIALGLTILISLICLGCSIRNTRVKNKPVRVINIVLSCFYAAALALGIVVIILIRVL